MSVNVDFASQLKALKLAYKDGAPGNDPQVQKRDASCQTDGWVYDKDGFGKRLLPSGDIEYDL